MRRISTVLLVTIVAMMVFAGREGNAQQAMHSALSEGEWWRVRITDEDLYRLSGNDINALVGSSINDIIMCGSLGGPLASTNGQKRPNDLEEISIEIHDNDGDGLFDSDDYILFYATGADRWSYDSNSTRYYHTRHPYSTANYVYVSHSAGNHKRIATTDSQTPLGSTLDNAHCLRIHDIDKVNTHRSGEVWVGERFSSSSREQTLTIPLGASRNGQTKVRYALASISSTQATFTITIAGQTATHSLGGSFPYGVFSMTLPASTGNSIDVNIQYSPNESMATGYLDFIEVDAEVKLSVDNTASVQYRVSNTTNATKVWDVTNYNSVMQLPTAQDGNNLTFTIDNNVARRIMVFSPSHAKTPTEITKLSSQDIHGANLPDMVIVCHPTLRSAAQRLASIHSIHGQMEVLVVTQDEVFNEFSSGQKDPIAIREMLRMFRSRALEEGVQPVSHLLLFGKGTYDNKDLLGSNLPTVVTYQTEYSFDDDGSSITTDDIFAYLDDGEDLTVGTTMDVAVGRLPAKSIDEANHLIDKIERYITKSDLLNEETRGDWRNSVALLADDADPSSVADTSFTVSSEYVASNISAQYPQINIDKIYADAYVQQSGADGSFYPDVNNALKKRMDYGCLLLNYIGHGSAQYIGTERFMMKSNISNYKNYDQLPYFVTSTCTFGRHDDPTETCGSEEFVLAEGGGIACLAATRPISHVQAVNNDMVMMALDNNNTIGEAVRKAKNQRYTTQALTLLGDPAIRLSIPTNHAVITKINGRQVDSLRNDTALVLSTVTIEGEIHDGNGALVNDFDGYIFPEVFDRAKEAYTLANDNEGCEVRFLQQNSLIYRGRANVEDGHFTFNFTVPRDVPYHFDL